MMAEYDVTRSSQKQFANSSWEEATGGLTEEVMHVCS